MTGPVSQIHTLRVRYADNVSGTGGATGWTVVQLIETSNICGHFVDENGDFYLDVFSCKDFNENIVTDYIQQCFVPETIKSEVFLRDARK